MDISQLINILGKQIKESDQTETELDYQAKIASQNFFKAKEQKKNTNQKSDQQKSNEKRPDSKKNPKQLMDKNKSKNITQNADFDEDDNPLAIFNAQITKNVSGDESEIPEDQTDDQSQQPTQNIDKNTNIKEKPFNLEYCKDYNKFVKIVNSFRATESINSDKVVKQYWEKLSLAEKQAIYIFFDNLTRVSDSEKNPNFKMPRSPLQLGIKMSNIENNTNKQKEIVQDKSRQKTQIDVNNQKDLKTSITPIVVGESKIRYISIDSLLKEVK